MIHQTPAAAFGFGFSSKNCWINCTCCAITFIGVIPWLGLHLCRLFFQDVAKKKKAYWRYSQRAKFVTTRTFDHSTHSFLLFQLLTSHNDAHYSFYMMSRTGGNLLFAGRDLWVKCDAVVSHSAFLVILIHLYKKTTSIYLLDSEIHKIILQK